MIAANVEMSTAIMLIASSAITASADILLTE
jgi:hypothetical protein